MPTATKLLATAANFGTLTFTGGGTITVTHVGLEDSGVIDFVAQLDVARPVRSGDGMNFPANTLAFTMLGINGAVIGDAVAKAMLDAALGASATLGAASYNLRLYSVAPIGDGTGGTEFPATGSYAVVAVTNNGTNFLAAAMV